MQTGGLQNRYEEIRVRVPSSVMTQVVAKAGTTNRRDAIMAALLAFIGEDVTTADREIA
jgi:hypothetical protein